VIALWLGHEDIQTTHVYLQADLAMKEKSDMGPAFGGAKA
jgi:integrase/recombinase XerD